ncbi:hypothetical protein ACVCDR_005881, partial [Klebsiella pneumoniae]
LCHGTVCVVGKMRDLILQLSKSSIYSTKPPDVRETDQFWPSTPCSVQSLIYMFVRMHDETGSAALTGLIAKSNFLSKLSGGRLSL